jgi:outer membrane protein assembly factor BamE (lipoprotein component of BamABCDE complex)
MSSHRLRRRAGLLAVLACLSAAGPALTACAPIDPVIEQRGYVLNEKDLKKLIPKVTTMDQAKAIMGTPSTVSTVNGVAWYYITSKMETYAFYPPDEIDRTVVAIYFDKQPTVQQVAYYGLQDGQIVDFITRTTPTRGKELTILGQMFSNLGKFNNKKSNSNTGPVPGGQH